MRTDIDKMNDILNSTGLITLEKASGLSSSLHDRSIDASFEILIQCGEDLPLPAGDGKLSAGIDRMRLILQSTSDDMICNMQKNSDKKMKTVIGIYLYLAHLLHYSKPFLVNSVSLRMVELTMRTGLSAESPLAFVHFGGVLVMSGFVKEGCRLGKTVWQLHCRIYFFLTLTMLHDVCLTIGRLALKLVEKNGLFRSRVTRFVYDRILWASDPLQSIAEAFLFGYKAGQQSGDCVYAFNNLLLAMYTNYFAGQQLDVVEKNVMGLLSKLQSHGVEIFYENAMLLLAEITVLKGGLHVYNITSIADASSGSSSSLYVRVHRLARAIFFRQVDGVSIDSYISGAVIESSHQLGAHLMMGHLFEGLASFLLARQSIDTIESAKWIERGRSLLTTMQTRSEYSFWNWGNKVLLLEAENMFTHGDFDRAEPLYDDAIRSARDHKFIHEEAVASELAGIFYYERGLHQKSYSYLAHSVNTYEKWGAHAVARRVETDIQKYFGTDVDQLGSSVNTSLDYIFATSQSSQRKRQGSPFLVHPQFHT